MIEYKTSISFCICVHNEYVELDRLLSQLVKFLSPEDEIIVQGDEGKVTDDVIDVVRQYISNVQYFEFPLNKDFATFKNNLISKSTKDYIFLIDADEIPHPHLLDHLKILLFENQDFEMFVLPRVNVVLGLTEQYSNSQRWVTQMIPIPEFDTETKNILKMYGIEQNTEINVVNPFDYQQRIFKNKPHIRYQGKVHERLPQLEYSTRMPVVDEKGTYFDFSWSLFHVKSIERQITQNNFYNLL